MSKKISHGRCRTCSTRSTIYYVKIGWQCAKCASRREKLSNITNGPDMPVDVLFKELKQSQPVDGSDGSAPAGRTN